MTLQILEKITNTDAMSGTVSLYVGSQLFMFTICYDLSAWAIHFYITCH